MNKSLLTGLISASLATVAMAQPSAYFQAVTNLNPAGYWPMHEVEAAVPGDTETNYGSIGILGTGFYPDWLGTPSLIQRGFPGAIAGDPDTATYFAFPASNNGGTTNSLYVPRVSPLLALNPPFSVECWFYPTNKNQGDIWSQSGFEGLNAGASGGGAGAVGGIRFYWSGTGFEVFTYHGSSALITPINIGNVAVPGTWYHTVLTVDASTNITLFVNGTQIASAANVLYTADNWTPFEVGNGRGNTRAVGGIVDELAVYTNVLSDIGAHYTAGTTAGSNPSYFQTVLNDDPTIYFRMDAPTYVPPAVATWPTLTNFGSTAVNGVYTPGTVPGVVTGPNAAGLAYTGLGNAPVALLSGVSSFADVGYNSLFDPIGPTPFSVIAMFRGNPSDNRFQNIAGHSDSSWRIALNTNGKLQASLGTNSASVLNSLKVYNDGNWHQVAFVYAPGATSTTSGTNFLYVDGVLDIATNNATTNGILPGSPLHIMLAADPQYTNNAFGVGRQFAGQVCEAAFFTNSLTAANIQTLYSAAGVGPFIITQPISATVNQNSAFTNTVVAGGSAPLAYQWYENGVKRTGQTNASLILNPVQPSDASTDYYVVVSNTSGSVTSSVVSLTVNSSPSFTLQPSSTNIILFAGGHATFTVAASGATPLNYQWFSNNVAISGATASTYSITSAPLGLSANYYATASNVAGSISSETITVGVISDPTAPYPAQVLADSPESYLRLNETPEVGGGDDGVIAHDYWGGNNGIYTNVALNQPGYNATTDPSETSVQFGLTGNSFFDSLAGQINGIDFSSQTNTTTNFSVEIWVNGLNQTISGAGIITKGYGNGGEQFDLDWVTSGYRFFVRDATGAVHGFTSTIQPNNTWQHLVGVCDETHGAVTLYVNGVAAGSGAIVAGNGILTSTNPVSIGARKSNSTTNDYDFQFYGNLNEAAFYNYALTAAQVANHYDSAGIVPFFTAQPPSSTNINQFGTLSVTVAAGGTPPLSYQWFDVSTGQPLAGQTSPTLTINNLNSSDSYNVTVSNLYGVTASSTLNVNLISGGPSIVTDLPAKVIAPAGHAYVYKIVAQGTEPLSYFWFYNGNLIARQTASTLTINAAAGTYSVTVSNIDGTAASTVSTLSTVAVPTNAFSSAVLALNPVGYWPLQETNAAAPVAEETNLGSLGAIGNAYYAITVPSQPNVTFDQQGALINSGDNDPSVEFAGPSGTNYAFVPRASTAVTAKAPFSWELWLDSNSSAFADVMSQGGQGINNPPGGGNFSGVRISYAGNNGGGPAFQVYAYTGAGGTGAYNLLATPANSLTFGSWHHCVMTYDGTTFNLYVDGNVEATAVLPLSLNPQAPLSIGDGRWEGDAGFTGPTRGYFGAIDEVAVYTNALSAVSISNHYLAANTPGSNYVQTVLADNPTLYFRMDSAGFVTPDPNTIPAVVNYGSAPVNGSYLPGTVPGGIAGPANLGSNVLASPINGETSAIDAGSSAAFNPTGTQPFTALIWERSYPSDGRVQTLIGHGGTNWALNLDGTTGHLVWNTYAGGSVTSSGLFNDGLWHFVAGVYDGTNNNLYVDGVLNNSAKAGAGLAGENTDVYLGGNSDFTVVGGNQQYFGGAITEAAVFTNALSGAQIGQLYNSSQPVTPTISVARTGGQLVITYVGTLVSSVTANGSYQPVAGASSPYTVPTTGTSAFYRARTP